MATSVLTGTQQVLAQLDVAHARLQRAGDVLSSDFDARVQALTTSQREGAIRALGQVFEHADSIEIIRGGIERTFVDPSDPEVGELILSADTICARVLQEIPI